jgi:hypothetical protein
VPLWKRTKTETQPYLLAKPMPLNINLGSDRFSMFNNERDIFVPQPERASISLHATVYALM